MCECVYINAAIYLELYSRLSDGSEGCSLPVGLFCLFPHHHVEGGGVLIAEDEAGIVIIRHRVHVECSLKVNPTERFVAYTCGQLRRNTQHIREKADKKHTEENGKYSIVKTDGD